ncbi:MAG: hypothetical protein FWD58_02475 [Firmicutes bacterium]|nr:hypothetical protein [Bacillota bacterium]
MKKIVFRLITTVLIGAFVFSLPGCVMRFSDRLDTHTHDFGDWTVTKASTCTAAGFEKRVCKLDPSHTETRVIPAPGHDFDAWVAAADGTEKGTCSVCGYVETRPASGNTHIHDFGAWVMTANGVEKRTCAVCGHTETRLSPDSEIFDELIFTKEQLIAFGSRGINRDNKKVGLGASIDLGGMEWTPIWSIFSIFDGSGFTVSNFKITDLTKGLSVGLFGGNVGIIQNLGVTDFVIDASGPAGGLIGMNDGTIINCYATGTVSINAQSPTYATAGGLVGFNNGGDIINCYASAYVNVVSENPMYAAAGGLVGFNNGGLLENCYATGDASVSAVSASNSTSVGGLIGFNNGGAVKSCFAAGSVNTAEGSAGTYTGRLTGFGHIENVTNCYWYTGQTFGTAPNNTLGVAATLANLQSERWIEQNLWAFESGIWSCAAGQFPTLNYEYVRSAVIEIATAAQLRELQGKTLTLGYKLVADIDLGGGEWIPMEDNFKVFNGNGHKISNFKILNSAARYHPGIGQGMLRRNSGTIQNLGLEGVTVDIFSTSANAGALTGFNGQTGLILNCYAVGSVTSAAESVSGATAGGLVGTNFGAIKNCYAVCDVSATAAFFSIHAGGLVGKNTGSGTTSGCFAAGNVSATDSRIPPAGDTVAYAGGLAGFDDPGSVTNCYRYAGQTFYRRDTSGTFNTANVTTGAACTLAQLNSATFYTATLGWDDPVWNLAGLDFTSGKYPV